MSRVGGSTTIYLKGICFSDCHSQSFFERCDRKKDHKNSDLVKIGMPWEDF
jgi:hypothetical protein